MEDLQREKRRMRPVYWSQRFGKGDLLNMHEKISFLEKENDQLKQKLGRVLIVNCIYEEALEFYADDETYNAEDYYYMSSKINEDQGSLARKALEMNNK